MAIVLPWTMHPPSNFRLESGPMAPSVLRVMYLKIVSKTPAWLWYIGDKHPIGHRWLKLRDLLSCGVLHCISLGAIINHVICQTFVLICVLTFEGRVWLTHYLLYFNIWGICCYIYFTLQRYLVEQWYMMLYVQYLVWPNVLQSRFINSQKQDVRF